MKQVAFLLSLFIISTFSYAQDFLVTHQSDTIIGNITLKGKVFVVESPGVASRIFPATEIAYVRSSKHTGTVLPCLLMLYSDNIEVVNKWNYNGGSLRDTVMVLKEVYTTPKMNLYQAPDRERSMYYFVKKPSDSIPIQMCVHYYMPVMDDWGMNKSGMVLPELKAQRSYVNQLEVMMADCKSVTAADLNMMDYRIYSFKKIIKRYNKCK